MNCRIAKIFEICMKTKNYILVLLLFVYFLLWEKYAFTVLKCINFIHYIIWAAQYKKCLWGICGQRRPSSDCIVSLQKPLGIGFFIDKYQRNWPERDGVENDLLRSHFPLEIKLVIICNFLIFKCAEGKNDNFLIIVLPIALFWPVVYFLISYARLLLLAWQSYTPWFYTFETDFIVVLVPCPLHLLTYIIIQ